PRLPLKDGAAPRSEGTGSAPRLAPWSPRVPLTEGAAPRSEGIGGSPRLALAEGDRTPAPKRPGGLEAVVSLPLPRGSAGSVWPPTVRPDAFDPEAAPDCPRCMPVAVRASGRGGWPVRLTCPARFTPRLTAVRGGVTAGSRATGRFAAAFLTDAL